MNRTRRLLAATGLLLAAVAAGPARADVKSDLAGVDGRLKACIAKNDSNAGMGTCTTAATAAADKLLNAFYNDQIARLKKPASPDEAADDRETLRRLLAAQRAWVPFKEADCDLQGVEMLGGSGEGLASENCLLSRTEERLKRLDTLFNTH